MENADKSPIENDSNAIKKRKRGATSEDSNCAVLAVAAQSHPCASLKDIRTIPSTPPVFGNRLRTQVYDIPLTPLSLDQPSSRKAKAYSPGENWYSSISQPFKKPSEILEMTSPKDMEDLCGDCMGSPAPKHMMHQEQLIKATLSNKVGMPDQGFSPPTPPRDVLPFNVSPSQDFNSLEQIQRETKQTKFDQHFSPMGGPNQRIASCNQVSGSVKGRAGLQKHIPDTIEASESLLQTECIEFRIPERMPEFPQVLIDLTELEDDDYQLDINKKPTSPSDPVQQGVTELKSYIDPTWLKQGCEKEYLNSKQDPSHTRHETDISGVAHQNNPCPGSKLASDGALAGNFSMALALQNYMCLRKESTSNPERKSSRYFPVIKPSVIDDMGKNDRSENSRSIKKVESDTVIPLMKPQYIIPTGRRYFIVSTNFLRNRKLACRIQRLYPGAEFIERDFALHKPSTSAFQHCPYPTSESMDCSLDEADMTISPGTGIILTTLQKIRQCSLPGQAVRLIVRERVARVAPRYERLLVLVSKDDMIDYSANNVAAHGIESDYKAAAEFVGFCSSLYQDTQAMLIAGKEEQLAEWIVAMMVKHAGVDLGTKLVSEETTWEIFLRRAGFNCFAAQAILSKLNGQSADANISTAGDVGLTAFLKMSVEKRVESFEEIFGGSALMKRVSSQLDARW